MQQTATTTLHLASACLARIWYQRSYMSTEKSEVWARVIAYLIAQPFNQMLRLVVGICRGSIGEDGLHRPKSVMTSAAMVCRSAVTAQCRVACRVGSEC